MKWLFKNLKDTLFMLVMFFLVLALTVLLVEASVLMIASLSKVGLHIA